MSVVTEGSQNHGHNPPMKSEGLRRPASKISMLQSQRVVTSTQSNPDDILTLSSSTESEGKVEPAESPLLVRLQPQQLTVMTSRPSLLALMAMTLRTRRTCRDQQSVRWQ